MKSVPGETTVSLAGSRLGPFSLLAELGRGPTGVVYRAAPMGRGDELAVKVINPWLAALPGFLDSLAVEVDAFTGLRHPRVVQVLGLAEAEGRHYLVRDLAPGVPLAGLLIPSMGGLDSERVLAIAGGVAEALDAAHAMGLVHGGLKPSNVFVAADDQATVADFAVARLADRALRSATGGAVVGDPSFLAPELIEGQPASPASDRYAFGILLYTMLAGRTPFAGTSPLAGVAERLTQRPPRLSTVRPGLPEALDSVFAMALARTPTDRYRSCAEIVRAVQAALLTDDATATPAPAANTRRRGGVLALGLVTLGIAAIVLFAGEIPPLSDVANPLLAVRPTVLIAASPTAASSPASTPATPTVAVVIAASTATPTAVPTATAVPAVTATVIPPTPTASPTETGPGMILFAHQIDAGRNDLYSMAPTGGATTPLWAAGPVSNWGVSVSADGEWLAFNTGTPDHTEIAVARRDGSQRRVVAPLGDVNWSSPWWLPDGRIAFGGTTPGSSELYAVAAEGGQITQLTRLTGALADVRIPTAPRAGDQLAFSGRQGTLFRIFVLPPAGSPRAISPEGSACYTPAWSPDGSLVAFSGQLADGRAGLFVMAPDGSGLRHLAVPVTGGWLCCPAWSLDGSQIAFVGDIGFGAGSNYGNLFVVPVVGGDSRRLTSDGRTYQWRPAWVP
jgi:hypothetical protein